MSEHWVSLISVTISFVGLMFVVVQLRHNTKQRESESLVEIYSINRELLALGFSHPQLFAILDDAADVDPVWERRYLQLWLNQLALIHSYAKQSTLRGELKDALLRDLSEIVAQKNLQKHWAAYGKFYPDSFRELVDDLINKKAANAGGSE